MTAYSAPSWWDQIKRLMRGETGILPPVEREDALRAVIEEEQREIALTLAALQAETAAMSPPDRPREEPL